MKFRYIFLLWLGMWGGLAGVTLAATQAYLKGGTQPAANGTAEPLSEPDCPPPSMRYDDHSCFLNGVITRDLTLTSDTRWVIAGQVFVGEDVGMGGDSDGGPTLTIEPGTRIEGLTGPDMLVISRGAKIRAVGRPDKPIVMTTEGRQTGRGQWGGLVINGLAPVNECDQSPCELQGEGRSGLYGGGRPEDNSGDLRYVQVRHAGHIYTAKDELNGIAFQGVGSGTRVDHVQVHNNADDGVELFGGTVDVSHLVLTGNADDSLDWTSGWRGTARNVLIRHTDTADHGIEADNQGDTGTMDAQPRSAPLLANVTIIGSGAGSKAVLLREGTAAEIRNTLITGEFTEGCVDVDDPATVAADGLRVRNSVIDCRGAPAFVDEPQEDWKVAGAIGWGSGNNHLEGVDLEGLRPVAGSPLRETPAESPAQPYTGAVGDSDWLEGWTYHAAPSSLTAARSGN